MQSHISKTVFWSLCLMCLTACNNGHSDSESKQDHSQGVSGSSAGKAFAGSLIAHYLHIKDGLIKGDSHVAADGAKAMLADLKSYQENAYPEKDRQVIGRALESLLDMAGHIKESANALPHQREHFRKLSSDIYYLATSFGYHKALYVFRCPQKEEEPIVLWVTEQPSNVSPYTGAAEQSCGTAPEPMQLPKS